MDANNTPKRVSVNIKKEIYADVQLLAMLNKKSVKDLVTDIMKKEIEANRARLEEARKIFNQ